MTLAEIREMPTSIDLPSNGIHESVLRSYQIVGKVRELLRAETPHCVIEEIILDLMDAPERRFSPRSMQP